MQWKVAQKVLTNQKQYIQEEQYIKPKYLSFSFQIKSILWSEIQGEKMNLEADCTEGKPKIFIKKNAYPKIIKCITEHIAGIKLKIFH